MWQGAIHGRGMSTIWRWDRSDDPKDEARGNILYRPDAVKQVGKVNFDLNRLSGEVTAIQKKKPEVALLFSHASKVYSVSALAHLYTAYENLLFNGQKVHVATDSQIEKIHDYKMLVLPDCGNVSKHVLNEIKKYAAGSGRIVIFGSDCLKNDDFNQPHDPATVTAIKAKATVVPTEKKDLNIASPSSEEIAQTFASIIKGAGLIKVELIDAVTGKKVENTEWAVAECGDSIVVNVNNHEWGSFKTIKVMYDGKQAVDMSEMRSNEKMLDEIILEPYVPVLLKFPKSEPSTLK